MRFKFNDFEAFFPNNCCCCRFLYCSSSHIFSFDFFTKKRQHFTRHSKAFLGCYTITIDRNRKYSSLGFFFDNITFLYFFSFKKNTNIIKLIFIVAFKQVCRHCHLLH